MFKARLQGFIAGLLATILLVSTLVLASGIMREVFYGVNVVVNGELQEFDDDMRPFISDGRTFLPIRGIAEALGVSVYWDDYTQTVHIGQPHINEVTIGILSGAQIWAFDLGLSGFQERMTELMEAEGKSVRFVYQNAGGDPATSTTIANTFAAQGVDLIFSMGTSASVTALPIAEAAEIPLVFGIITDPIGNGLVVHNVSTGASNALPMETQIDLLEELLGGELNAENRVAFLYTTDEPNSVAMLWRLQAVAPEDTIIPFGIPNGGLGQLTQQFINIANDPTIRAIYIPSDNQIASNMQMVQNLNRSQNPEHRLPIVVADLPIVADGAVASLSVDFAAIGSAATDIAFGILVNGTWPDTFYSPTSASMSLYINQTEADAIGFEIPASLVTRANRTL